MNIFQRFWTWLKSLFGGKVTPAVTLPSMDPARWQFQYSAGVPANPYPAPGGGWQFAFPDADGVHYLVCPVNMKLSQALTLSFELRFDGDPVWACHGDTPPAHVCLYFQRNGDNLSGLGAMEFYRWFCWAEKIDLVKPGTYSITAPIDPSKWISVYGKDGTNPAAAAGWIGALSDVGAVGMTFGGQSFAGHGANVASGGGVTFKCTGFSAA